MELIGVTGRMSDNDTNRSLLWHSYSDRVELPGPSEHASDVDFLAS